jgi:hypothetical protein
MSADSAMALNLALSSVAGSEPASLQWTLTYPAASVSNISVAAGPAATAAGKSVSCASGSAGYTCVLYGVNSSVITNGIVAVLTVTVASGAGSVIMGVSGAEAASLAGSGSTVTISVSINGSTAAASISLVSAIGITSLRCSPGTLGPNASATCTVMLTQTAPVGGVTINISSNSSLLTVPASVVAGVNSTSVSFTAAAGAFTGSQTAVVSAVIGSAVPVMATISLAAQASNILLTLNGTAGEVSGVSNGSTVTPTTAPSGMTGKVVVNGSGSANFVAGSGVYFLNCCANTNNAYYTFTGAGVGSVFGIPQGQISFTLTSRSSFAQRQSVVYAPRYAFNVRAGNGLHQFYFLTQVVSGRYLQLVYVIAGTAQYYDVPRGTEDELFGNGVSLNVTLKWDGNTTGLYLNGVLVKSAPLAATEPNWNRLSTFDLGACEYLTFGGFNSSDDVIADFVVRL